jgi:hypothetical protein
MTNIKILIAVIGLVMLVSIVLLNFGAATVYPSYNNATDCRGCHGSDNSTTIPTPATRHHQLVVNGTFVCTDCHPVIYNNVTQTYSTELIRDCLVCHVGKNHTNIHHILTSQGLFVCSDCHPVIFNNQTQTYQTQVSFNCPDCHSTVLSIQNGTPAPTPTPTPTPDPNAGPTITNFSQISPVFNIVGDSAAFGITTDQIVNVTWFINDSQVQIDNSVTNSSYINTSASLGTWNVTAVASNINGIVMYNWSWSVTTSPHTVPPQIGYAPITYSVTDFAGASRIFKISTDQITNITWYINGSQVQLDVNVTQSSYTNTSSSPGIWNVNAVASNINGSVSQSWVWNVIPPIPYITSFSPNSTVVNDTTGNSRNFTIVINQTANVTWYINNSQVQSNNSVTNASFNISSVPITYLGVSNVSAIASNIYGSDKHNWTWNVTSSPKTPTGLHAAVDCSVCHSQKITEVTCYQCHNNSANSANGTNIYLQFTMRNDTYPGLGINNGYYNYVNTRHDITDSDQNYSSTKLECTNCHSAHNASKTNVLINPEDNTSFNKTMIHPGTGKVIPDYVTFCLKCHDNTWSPNVIGPLIISNISYWYLMNLTKGDWHGAASGDKFNNTYLIGPYASQAGKNNVPAMPCNDCHDSHGSSSLYHLKTLTDQYGVNMTITSANINSSDVDHWCSHCHKDPMQTNTSQQIRGNCLTSHCHSHGNRF